MRRDLTLCVIFLCVIFLMAFACPSFAQKNKIKESAVKQYNLGIELGNKSQWQAAVEAYKKAIPPEHWQAVFHDNAVRVFKFPGWKELK